MLRLSTCSNRRSSLKQYMAQKPVKRGYKVWVRAGAKTAYMYQFDIYAGKSSDESSNVGLGTKVVLKLTTSLSGTQSHVTFDNFSHVLHCLKRCLLMVSWQLPQCVHTIQICRHSLDLRMIYNAVNQNGKHDRTQGMSSGVTPELFSDQHCFQAILMCTCTPNSEGQIAKRSTMSAASWVSV